MLHRCGTPSLELKVGALGVQAPVANDTFRSSQVEMLLGTSTVEFTDHGMTYTFDAAKVMFSSGNVTERRRIGALDMDGEVVVDAYAGVGYYTFPMLVHAGAATFTPARSTLLHLPAFELGLPRTTCLTA